MLGFNKTEIIKEVKQTILQELILDREFREKMRNALGIKEEVIILNGENVNIEVKPKC